jgi:tRNA A37 threonylcarbamoyladenosine biosynthesis protein TsaE
MRVRVSSRDELARLARGIISSARDNAIRTRMQEGDIILLRGSLGVGKTAFAGQILRHCCPQPSKDEAVFPSPSFVRLYEYPLLTGGGLASTASSNTVGTPATAFHIDLYRCTLAAEVTRLALPQRAFAAGNLALVEWPERLLELSPELVPEEFLLVNIEIPQQSHCEHGQVELSDLETRDFVLNPVGDQWRERCDKLRDLLRSDGPDLFSFCP